jgi:hypothetical protein
MDEQVLTWLADNREVEILTLKQAPDGLHKVHELLWLSRFPRLASLTVDSDIEASGSEKQQGVMAPLGPAPLASLTSFTLDSRENAAECHNADLAPLLAGCKLRHLDLGGCALGESASGDFAGNLYKLLPAHAGTLQSLAVNINSLHDDEEGLALAAALAKLPGLRRLAFRDWQYCHHLSAEASAALGQALSCLPALESLDCLGMIDSNEEVLGSSISLNLPPSIRRLENLSGINAAKVEPSNPDSAPAFRMARSTRDQPSSDPPDGLWDTGPAPAQGHGRAFDPAVG